MSDLSEENVVEEESDQNINSSSKIVSPIFQYPNEYNYSSPYLTPVYYVNIDCVPPMPFISYTGKSKFSRKFPNLIVFFFYIILAPPYLSSPDDFISAEKPTEQNNTSTDADKGDTKTLVSFLFKFLGCSKNEEKRIYKKKYLFLGTSSMSRNVFNRFSFSRKQ